MRRAVPALLTAAVAAAGSAATAGCSLQPPDQARAMAMAAVDTSPASSVAVGRLVAGIPGVVPIPPGATVTASAIERRGPLVAVSVTGTSRSDGRQLLAFFHDRLDRASFTATDDSLLPPGASGAAFGRGAGELLLVAVVDHGAERSWSVGGTVVP